MPDPFPISADVWALAQAADKAAMRDVLDVVPGTDVQVYDPKLVTGANFNPMYVAAFKNVPVLTTGAPADIASITLPAWLTGYIISPISSLRIIAESASGTLAAASFFIRTGPNSTGFSLASSGTGPTGTTTAVHVNGTITSVPRASGNTLYLHQGANSANAGVVSVYLILMPLL
jgi:hypothetical protein